MGRKPNQLILEFFDRGPKLEDASNRYQHTCRACGDHFPKGRIDNLITHLTKICQGISTEDRQRAVLRFKEDGVTQQGSKSIPHRGTAIQLPVGEGRKLTGLEALAEASRQIEFPGNGGEYNREEDSTIDPSLRGPEMYGRLFDGQIREQSGLGVSTGSDIEPFSVFHYPDSPSAATFMHTSSFPPSSTYQAPTSLPAIAASASSLEAMMPHALALPDARGADHTANPTDASLDPHALRYASTWPTQKRRTHGDPQDQLASTMARAATYPRAIAISPSGPFRGTPGSLIPSKISSSQKIRGKFSDLRRKEVQAVRKKGACIRCRMLRKTCSGGDPCSSCANVEAARLWKQPCTRTRIGHEFDLYSAALYSTMASQEVNHAKSQYQFQQYSGHIQIRHDPVHEVYITCKGLIGQLDILEHAGYHTEVVNPLKPTESIVLLNDSGEDLLGKIEIYAKEIAPVLYAQEPLGFMSVTLSIALELSLDKDDVLLSRVLELWVLTHLLADLTVNWQMLLDPINTDRRDGSTTGSSSHLGDNTAVISEVRNTRAYTLLRAQLRAAIEKAASVLSKKVFNDLERRLLQRSQCQGFETFLLTIILMNCVEKMCWLFQTWEDDQLSLKWPFGNRPTQFAKEGEIFSDLMCMLLKMRGVPPRTQTDPETGFLIVNDRNESTASRWFESVKLTNEYLEERRHAAFDPTSLRSFELKFASKILLP